MPSIRRRKSHENGDTVPKPGIGEQLQVLIVEDVAADAGLTLTELRRAGVACKARVVQTADDYRRALTEMKPDVILCDFRMPAFNGMEALAIAHESYSDIPFIFVSGAIGEDDAVRALKNGAADYAPRGGPIC